MPRGKMCQCGGIVGWYHLPELTPRRIPYIPDHHSIVGLWPPMVVVSSLNTQRECLEMLGCVGATRCTCWLEIVAGVVLAGEISGGRHFF